MKLILFDCDGTLVDSQYQIHAAMAGAFDRAGLAAPEINQTRSIIGLSLELAIAQLLEERGENTNRSGEIADHYRGVYHESSFEDARRLNPLFPGVNDGLDELFNVPEILCGVATGKGRRGLEKIMTFHGWHGRFITTQTGDDAPSKPHPGMIENALRETGADLHNTTMIGDTEFDMAMAKSAGVQAFGVSWGYHPVSRLQDAGADKIYDSFKELTADILSL